MRRLLGFLGLCAVLLMAVPAHAQQATLVQSTTPATSLVLIPISTTAAVNTAATLTIPAPAGGLYNYICSLTYQVSTDATGGANTNVVTTSTNFNSFAIKFSNPTGVNLDSGVQTVLNSHGPTDGCAKSAAPGVATTFVSPAAMTHQAWSWTATYFQAP